jgi:hypothetical protein
VICPHTLRRVLALLPFTLLCFASPPAEWNVLDYGAQGDGRTLNTLPIQSALDDCLRFGGGRVLLPRGIFLSGTLHLRSNCRLVLAEGAVLRGSPNLDDYLEPLAHSPYDKSHFVNFTASRRLFLYGDHISNAAIEGHGTIDGARVRELNGDRGPLSIFFQHSSGITLQDVTVTNSPGWAVTFFDCRDVRILGARLRDVMADGINPVSCQNILYDGVVIDGTGDDPICIKNEGPPLPGGYQTRNIHIRNTVVRNTTHPAIKIGTGTNGTFDDILVEDCTFQNRGGLFVIQLMRPSQRGELSRHIRNVTLRRIDLNGAGRLFDITAMGLDSPVIHSLNFQDIRFRGTLAASRIHGTSASPVRAIAIRGLQVESGTPADCLLSLRHVEGLELSGLQLQVPATTLFLLFETRDARFSSIRTSPVETLVSVSGSHSRNIRLAGAPPSGVVRPLAADASVPAGALLPSADPRVTGFHLPSQVRPNEPLEATADLHNPGPAGAARLPLLVEGRESAAAWVWLAADARSAVRLSGLPLYRPGLYHASVHGLHRTFRLRKAPAGLALSEPCQVEWPRTAGTPLRLSVPVRNLGGSPGTLPVALESQGHELTRRSVTVEPGQESPVEFAYSPAIPSFQLAGFPEWSYATFRNVPGRFLLYRDRIAIEAGGLPARWDQYAAVYLPTVEGDFDAQVRVLSASEETGEYSAAGLLVRNRIGDTASPGLVMHFRVPKYGGYKIAIWDSGSDGAPGTRSDGGPAGLPVWYRLEKRGQRFRLLASSDGIRWRPAGAPGRSEFTLRNAAPRQDVGFFASAWNAHGRLARVEFSDFSVHRIPGR